MGKRLPSNPHGAPLRRALPRLSAVIKAKQRAERKQRANAAKRALTAEQGPALSESETGGGPSLSLDEAGAES